MEKLNCIICDKCRRVCTDNHISVQGKKRTLHYCKQCYRSDEDSKLIDTFVNRLKKIGIEVELSMNVPWIYLDKINGKKVIEKFESDHNFTVAWFPVNINNKACFSDITEIFKLIKKYIMKEKIIQLLSDLAAFNELNSRIIQIISDVFETNAEKICKDNGITYFTE
jgi:hypothetical protein